MGDVANPNQMLDSKQEPSPKSDPSSVLPTYLTPARIEIIAWLQRNDAEPLADLYEAAIRLVFDDSFPGRLRLIGHAVREIRNRLPDFVAVKIRGGRLEYSQELNEIEKMWTSARLPLDGSFPISEQSSDAIGSTQPGVPIPRELFSRIGKLIRDHKAIPTKNKDKARRLYEACDPENTGLEKTLIPVIEQWWDVTEWFMKKTHVSRENRSNFDEQELQGKFELFETALRGLARGFFSTLDELDEILERTNS